MKDRRSDCNSRSATLSHQNKGNTIDHLTVVMMFNTQKMEFIKDARTVCKKTFD